MTPGYPKDLYAKDGSFLTVKNQYEEEEYVQRGWIVNKPRPEALPVPDKNDAKKESDKKDEVKK